MVFLIVAGEVKGKVLLVRAKDEKEIRDRFVFAENEDIIGGFTTSDILVLTGDDFAVVSCRQRGG